MDKCVKNLVYVLDKSHTIRVTVDLFLSTDYEVLTFEKYEFFNDHIQNQIEFRPSIVLIENSQSDNIFDKNNKIIMLTHETQKILKLDGLFILKPFNKEGLIETVKIAHISLFKNILENKLSKKNVSDENKIKI